MDMHRLGLLSLSPSPLHAMQLPPKLIAHILTFIFYDVTTQTLLACMALVCRAWAPLAQAYLYGHMLSHRKGQWSRARRTLQERPHRRSLVHTLEFAGVRVSDALWFGWTSVDFDICITPFSHSHRHFGHFFLNL